MDIFYLLGEGKVEDASNKILEKDLVAVFTLAQAHFLVLTFIEARIFNIEELKMINEHCIKTKDLSLLNTKAVLQYKLGDVDDAKDTIKKAEKVAKKNKLILSESFLVLKAMIK